MNIPAFPSGAPAERLQSASLTEEAEVFPLSIVTCWRFHVYRGARTCRKNRPDYQVIYTHSGRARITVGKKTELLLPGSVVMIDCMRLHEYEPDCDSGWLYSYMHVAGSAMDTYRRFLCDTLCVLYPPNPLRIEKNLSELMLTHWQKDPASNARITALIADILSEMISVRFSEQGPVLPCRSAALHGAIRYIDQNYMHEITIGALAAASNMSCSGFSHLFRQLMGLPPYHYITQYRIRQAQRLLLSTDEQISEVAGQTGFSTPSNFISHFRRLTGFSPAQWRAAMRTENAEH